MFSCGFGSICRLTHTHHSTTLLSSLTAALLHFRSNTFVRFTCCCCCCCSLPALAFVLHLPFATLSTSHSESSAQLGTRFLPARRGSALHGTVFHGLPQTRNPRCEHLNSIETAPRHAWLPISFCSRQQSFGREATTSRLNMAATQASQPSLPSLPAHQQSDTNLTAHIASRYHVQCPVSYLSSSAVVSVNTYTSSAKGPNGGKDGSAMGAAEELATRALTRLGHRQENQAVLLL